MGLVKKMKLYRIATILSIVPKYWKSSKEIAQHVHAKYRLWVYFDMLSCLMKYGASDENYLQFRFYGKDYAYRNSFTTWRRSITLMNYTPRNVIDLFLDKARFNQRFAKYIHRGWLDCNHATEQQILDFAKQYPTVIIKPMDSAGGIGIIKSDYNKLIIQVGGVNQYVGNNFIIEETLENHEAIKQFNPSSLNTLRMVTFTDKDSIVHLMNVVLRVGRDNSIMDNAHAGGIACCVDMQTGKLIGPARTFKDEVFEVHPTSGIQFDGYQIPNFKKCVDFVKQLASEEKSARLVGWDIVVTPVYLEVLEANIPPGEDLTELNLKGKFLEIMNVI